MASTPSHTWSFFRAGGFDQVSLLTGTDIANLDQLDQKLWVALACPSTGLEFDAITLALIDSDKDGRIRAPEVIAAAKWATSCLKNPDDLLKGAAALPLSAISDATPDGKAILASAKQILANLGKKDATEITLGDTADTAKIFAQTQFNGDGIVPADSASDDATKAVIADVIACLGAETDRSGKAGANQAKVDQFFAELNAFSTWWAVAEKDGANVLPLGDGTAAAFGAFNAVKAKVDDYFSRCRLAAFDARALAALNRQESEYLAVAAKDLSITAAEVSGFPLARIEAGKALPLKTGLNPAWAAAVTALAANVIKPLVGDKDALTEAEWTTVSGKFAAFSAWSGSKAGLTVEKLGLKRVREILAGGSKDAITALIAKDKALEPEVNAIAAVDKLLHYHRDLAKLLVNFVSFRDFYAKKDKAVFQVGTLYLDTRSCELCILVQDAGKHAAMAGLAGSYLAYCDCVRKSTGEKMQIVAAFTDGDSDNLMVGRNGVFYDRKGNDWDATITKIVDNPISIRQAFWAPYKKLVRMIEEMAAKRAAAADAEADKKLANAATATVNADKAKPEPKKIDVGTVAAMGVAFGAIGTLVTTLIGQVTGLFDLPFWKLCLAVVGILLVISGPSMIIAWLKLRKRNLGPILDANGWAVNAKARLNVPFGASLTNVAKLPAGAKSSADDKFGEKPNTWVPIAKFIIVVCFIFSLLNDFYVLDMIAHKATGNHYSFLKSPESVKAEAEKKAAEAKQAEAKKQAEAAAAAAAAATNAPAAK